MKFKTKKYYKSELYKASKYIVEIQEIIKDKDDLIELRKKELNGMMITNKLLRNENKALECTLNKVTNSRNKLKGKLSGKSKNINNLEGTRKECNKALKKAQKELDFARNTIIELNKEIKTLKARLNNGASAYLKGKSERL